MARKINSIILHCSATPDGKDFHASDIDKWHKARGFRKIGYHYVITLDGAVETGRTVNEIGAHCVNHNAHSIGICYIGGVTKDGKTPCDTRTDKQKSAMFKLVDDLLRTYHLKQVDIYCHNQFANKACPSFKITDFIAGYLVWKEKENG